MIYDCLFESVWFTFREQVAPALSINLDKIKAFRLSASCHSYYEWQAAGSRRKKRRNSRSRCYDYHYYDDKWLSFMKWFMTLFWEPSRFYWTKSDRNGSETQSESRDEQGIIPRVNKESVRNEGSYTPLTVGVLCPAYFHLKSHMD